MGDNNQHFSIITNTRKEDKDYKELLKLKNLYSFNPRDRIISLPNYYEFRQRDFYEILKDILDLRNPVEKTIDDDKKSIEEIMDNFIITATIFLRMAYIILRMDQIFQLF